MTIRRWLSQLTRRLRNGPTHSAETPLTQENIPPQYARHVEQGEVWLAAADLSQPVSDFERRVRNELQLWVYPYSVAPPGWEARLEADIKAVRHVPGLAPIYLMHADGRVREAALSAMQEPLQNPVLVSILIWRLNDWAAPVRAAAVEACNRVLPETEAATILPGLLRAVEGLESWGRWRDTERAVVFDLLHRPDLAEALRAHLTESRTARLGPLFQAMCRNPAMEAHLPRIARDARQPHLRAMALEALLAGRVRWPRGGKHKQWIDRSMNQFRWVPDFESRPLDIEADPLPLIETGARDRAAIVRKHAADAVIAYRNDPVIGPDMDSIAARLAEDRNVGVRARIAFFHRKRAEEQAP